MSTVLPSILAALLFTSPAVSPQALTPYIYPAPANKPMGLFVGELQERWQFSSDHLPIGMTWEGIHLASWNILNAEYMSWVIEKNSQGLSRSLIAEEHVYIEGTGLTFRDLHVIDHILTMLEHPTHQRSLIALQECSMPFIAELNDQLPEQYGIVLSSDLPLKDQTLIIYDKNRLEFLPDKSEMKNNLFSIQTEHEVMNLCFFRKDTGQALRVFNAHLPGLPGNPAPQEFAAYVVAQTSEDEIAIAMGDMNANEMTMDTAFRENLPAAFHYTLLAPYCTNISPANLHSKSIDHFFVLSKDEQATTQNGAEEVVTGLQETLDLIQPAFFISY